MIDYFKFQRAVVCDGRACASDEIVAGDELPSGTLETCLRMGHCVPCDRAGVAFAAAAEPDANDDAPRAGADAPANADGDETRREREDKRPRRRR
jgi:hypothetical protein